MEQEIQTNDLLVLRPPAFIEEFTSVGAIRRARRTAYYG